MKTKHSNISKVALTRTLVLGLHNVFRVYVFYIFYVFM